jgi:hypothetical protein
MSNGIIYNNDEIKIENDHSKENWEENWIINIKLECTFLQALKKMNDFQEI